MSLLERLEAKRREVDQQARASIGDHDYLWWCDLRDLLDEIAATAKVPMMVYENIKVEPEWPNSPGYIVYANKNV